MKNEQIKKEAIAFANYLSNINLGNKSVENLWAEYEALFPKSAIMTADEIDLLMDYSQFLEDRNYLDSDWREEHPAAIEEYRKKKWKDSLE